MGSEVEHYSVWVGKDNRLEKHTHSRPYRFEEKGLHPSHRIDKIDVEVFGQGKVGVAKITHGDENPVHLRRALRQHDFNGVHVRSMNPLAEKIGRHGFVYPLPGEVTPQPKGEIVELFNTKPVKKDAKIVHKGTEINHNREFAVPDKVANWEELYQSVNVSTRPFIRVLEEHKNIEYWIFVHKDLEFGRFDFGYGGVDPKLGECDGGYIYLSTYDARDDKTYSRIGPLVVGFHQALRAQNFHLCTGYVAPEEPEVNYWADDGFVYQPVIWPDGSMPKNDTAAEQCVVKIGQRFGLTQTVAAITAEIPGGLSSDREKQYTEILVSELITKLD